MHDHGLRFSHPLFYLITKHFYAEDMIDIIESVKKGQGIHDLDFEWDIVEGMMLQYLLVFTVVFLSYLSMHFITRHLWQPFNDTLREMERFNLERGDIPKLEKTDIREFDHLNRSLIRLMERDRKTFRMQKEFSENASHELQTPLAVMRGKLDLLLQEEMSERQTQLVSDLYQLTSRMSHLSRDLLLLAKIDNAQYAQQEEIDITATLKVSLPMYDLLYPGITIHLNDLRTNRTVRLRANPFLLESLLKNLVVNALHHTVSGKAIRILIEEDLLEVSNPSADNVPLDTSSLFLRYQSSEVQSGGNGLGLAIVKAVCDFHGWTVRYEFRQSIHYFIVTF